MNKRLAKFIPAAALSLLMIFAFVFLAASAAFAEGPGGVVTKTIERGIKILRDPSLQGMDQFLARRDKLWSEIRTLFDFDEASRRALGPHWNTLNPSQQKEFTETFINTLKGIYLSKSDAYSGERIEFVREIVDGKRAKVRTNLYISNEKKIVIDFSLHDNNGWKVYDLQIEGVSIISNYRSQFNSVLSKQSFEALLKELKEKQNEI